MNVLGKSERSWRKARKRGVSPIIATILLVAITVVLAAVLYVLIAGLTHGPSSAPLAFGWGQGTNATGTSNTPGCSSLMPTGFTTKFCYTDTIAPTGGLTTSNVQLSLRNSAGATIAWPAAASVVISLLSPTATGAVAAYCAYATSGIPTTVTTACSTANTWTTSTAFSGTFSSGMTVVIAIAGGQAAGNTGGLLGISIEAVGTSGYSGVQTSPAFT